jgi:hypothetical protein
MFFPVNANAEDGFARFRGRHSASDYVKGKLADKLFLGCLMVSHERILYHGGWDNCVCFSELERPAQFVNDYLVEGIISFYEEEGSRKRCNFKLDLACREVGSQLGEGKLPVFTRDETV